MSTNERIKELRTHLKMTQTEFGNLISLTQNHLTGIESGKRNVTDRTIKLICSISWPPANSFVNEEWLLTGKGSMFIEKDPDQEFMEAVGSIDFHNNELIKKVIIDYMKLSDENKKRLAEYIIELAEIAKKELKK